MLPKHVRYRTALHPEQSDTTFRDLTNIHHVITNVNTFIVKIFAVNRDYFMFFLPLA